MTLAFLLTLVALGFLGAFVSGLVGVGGAIVMIPLLLYVPPLLGVGSLDVKHVTGVTMAQVLTSAALGAWTHGRGAKVHHRLALNGGMAMATGALLGALASHLVSGRALLAIFALMATIALPLMFVPPVPPTTGPGVGTHFSRPRAALFPGLIGLASGLVGAG